MDKHLCVHRRTNPLKRNIPSDQTTKLHIMLNTHTHQLSLQRTGLECKRNNDKIIPPLFLLAMHTL